MRTWFEIHTTVPSRGKSVVLGVSSPLSSLPTVLEEAGVRLRPSTERGEPGRFVMVRSWTFLVSSRGYFGGRLKRSVVGMMIRSKTKSALNSAIAY